MKITKLRLLGFKSFVEPTELVIEKGLTGVVGPNGCGKSNLLEALRWVMGETSYKSMRASSMDDVIFNGTNQRPPRNMAEVTIFVDNSARLAPAEFNDSDVLEVTRRIEREMGSAYRVNSRETRAKDIKILFEDAATGARSPALVRQGQIAEIVNAKPEQRRRILEDAAGVAGLHSRRHDAELRLKAAEQNLARVADVLGQLNSQIESLKRQARHARRYKELSAEIRRAEALLAHLGWVGAEAAVVAAEGDLHGALERLAAATASESEVTRLELEAAEVLPGLREREAQRSAALHRIKVEQETFEREAKRNLERQRELEIRIEHLLRDRQREEALAAEAEDSIERLGKEKAEIEATCRLAREFEAKALAAFEAAEVAVRTIEQRLSGLQTAAAEARARRKSLEQQRQERRIALERVERQRTGLAAQLAEIMGRAPDASKLTALSEEAHSFAAGLEEREQLLMDAEARVLSTSAALKPVREAAQAALMKSDRLRTEVETLMKLLKPQGDGALPPVVDQMRVTPGYEAALGAALGEDLEAPVADESPVRWRLNVSETADPELPEGAAALSDFVIGPTELKRRLQQIGVVEPGVGARLQAHLKPGQRLVSRAGDLWRWDGFVAAAHGETAAAARLAQRNRLGDLADELDAAHQTATELAEKEAAAAEAYAKAEDNVRRLRLEAREAQTRLASARETLSSMERQAQETNTRIQTVRDALAAAEDALVETRERAEEVEMALDGLTEAEPFEEQLSACQEDAIEKRAAVSHARADLATLEREHKQREERLSALDGEIERWVKRKEASDAQRATFKDRLQVAEDEFEAMANLPELIEEQRQKLLDALTDADRERQQAADALQTADNRLREIQQQLRAAQGAVSTAREEKARTEARLEGARTRRADETRKIRETLDVAPEACLALSEFDTSQGLPLYDDIDRQLARLKGDRERLGGVNLAADDDLVEMQAQYDAMDKERSDVEEAIAKLRGGINELNKDAKSKLDAAFEAVNGHFQRLFGVLFGGGEARLEMVESPEDPLEGGLEIIAKPPGKKPATLSLLSGGEQTLTALSLIFAVFLTNPSPICVLDEVDAPLDDSNVDRFCLMMERMAEETETRFLVITHHPMTMARMHRLFGVTMAERGVSQLVSVDLEIARKLVEEAA
ncbi:MAG TPA: chromosome segregation protein SMC [Hyphomicrobiaceae bacterium]|nr:chromosome segregation protein SMC [Hyphomicrobiaceae bacterium]